MKKNTPAPADENICGQTKTEVQTLGIGGDQNPLKYIVTTVAFIPKTSSICFDTIYPRIERNSKCHSFVFQITIILTTARALQSDINIAQISAVFWLYQSKQNMEQKAVASEPAEKWGIVRRAKGRGLGRGGAMPLSSWGSGGLPPEKFC